MVKLSGLSRAIEENIHFDRRTALAEICALVLAVGEGCRKSAESGSDVTLTMMDQSWLDKEFQRQSEEELSAFRRETGIPVKVLPAPDAAIEQLALFRNLLHSGAKVPDVYAIDVIWPAILASDLLDLKTFVPAEEIGAHFPELIANNTVGGRLVALPYQLNTGLLLYRTDLLRRYGYRTPPRTWKELEDVAGRIQAGERARGHNHFWGFVWEGALSEALTCNALEWQASEGGGEIVEHGAMTVNNPRTAMAWERASKWIGSISPPGVAAYKEADAFNLWQAGEAAFMRNWPEAYVLSRASTSPVKDDFDVSALPAGCAGSMGTLGGRGYGVSRFSLHPKEAGLLVRYLCRRDVQLRRSRKTAGPPTIPELYREPAVLAANPYLAELESSYRKGFAVRPSTETGAKYSEVSLAYSGAVHSVLTRQNAAESAAAGLETELMRITGYAGRREQTIPACAN